MWVDLLAEKTSRTAAFRTDWSRCSISGAPAIRELQESSLLMTSDRSMVSMTGCGREWRTLRIWHSMAKHARTERSCLWVATHIAFHIVWQTQAAVCVKCWTAAVSFIPCKTLWTCYCSTQDALNMLFLTTTHLVNAFFPLNVLNMPVICPEHIISCFGNFQNTSFFCAKRTQHALSHLQYAFNVLSRH